ncbi:conserved hypothetical protein [Altererythrobacter sp. B11]|uniref:DUF4396 domain-containing protein n=1 Tax=Altererythrobacter sp. B11 TaxID=2060312 RepID=UPI000DC6D8B4|nr:DUF4396 domain-containing protein [Altererythrobacter sp. B11]BBC72459.1 conserved hypothetical protein [Altererythrobacter sp. B11]
MPQPDFPAWLHWLAILSLAIGGLCALWIVDDVRRHPQKMAIMNVVWPLTALFGSVLWLWFYLSWGRLKGAGIEGWEGEPPFWIAVAKGASHCGGGCTLGDIIAEWAAFAMPALAVWFGWHTLFAEKLFAVWVLDYLVAFLLGVIFQYFTIKPMRDLSVGQGIWQAVKADAASITSWQVGMYGLMALIQFAWFRPAYGGLAEVSTPEFWFAMQLAMLAGFCTAFPVNWWLVRAGLKERM